MIKKVYLIIIIMSDFIKCLLFDCKNDNTKNIVNNDVVLTRQNIENIQDFIFNLTALLF